jgi:hypothetical protein
MPGGAVNYQTLASTGVGNADEFTWFPTAVTITNLAAGTNILAVEVHQSAGNSSDLGMSLELFATGYLLPAPVPPPTLAIDRDSTHIFVRWPANAAGYNLYGASSLGGAWSLVGAPTGTTNNQKVVTISPANAAQFYRLSKP